VISNPKIFTTSTESDSMHNPSSRYLFILLVGFTFLIPNLSHAKTQDSIVKVFTTATTYDYDSPWLVAGIEEASGSGCIISGQRILTNAHVVSDAVYIQVQRYGDPNKFIATVIAVSHEADLALLQVENDAFFDNTTPLELGVLPELLDGVVVYGFPKGGEGLSVTKGIVSRIEITKYVHSRLQFLGLQIDAAINSGNSGGPVIMDSKIIGVAMQTMEKAENIGYIIPVPIIEHFLTDLQDGNYDGFPDDGVLVQTLENMALRASLSLPNNETGVYVAKVIPGTSADGLLKPGDVILSVDDHQVANDGSVLLRPGLRVQSGHYVSEHQIGDSGVVSIWRNGTKQTVSIPLTTKQGDSQLVKRKQYDSPPEYYIVAGIILTPLSQNYLATWGEEFENKTPWHLLRYFYEKRQKADEEVVIINGFLSSKMTSGYQEFAEDRRVISINGQSFASFKELTILIDNALTKDDPITFITEDHAVVVVSPTEHRKNETKLLELYGIDESKRVR